MLLYHVAPASARASIDASGLFGASSHDRWTLRSEPIFGVFGWESIEGARAWAARDLVNPHETTVDVWEIDAGDDLVVEDPQTEVSDAYAGSWVIMDEGVAPERLRRLGSLPSGDVALTASLDVV